MKIKNHATAGTLESSDAFVQVSPNDTLEIELQSSVMEMYGKQIKATIDEVLKAMEVEKGTIKIDDKGALDFVLKARIQAAILRSNEKKEANWSVL